MTIRNMTILGMAAVATLAAEARFDFRVRDDFFAGLAGDTEALARGMKTCEEVLAANPQAAEAMVWHGVGLFAQSGQLFRTGNPTEATEKFGRGLKEMEDARSLTPRNPGVLIPRGSALLAGTRLMPPGPSTRQLLMQGLEDYEKVLEIQRAKFDSLSGHQRGELLFGLAEGYSRAGDTEKARLYFEKLAAVGPSSGHAAQAKEWLDTGKIDSAKARCAGCHVR